MSKRIFKPWISLPYAELIELYEMVQIVKQLKCENKRLSEQLASLRFIQFECLEKYMKSRKICNIISFTGSPLPFRKCIFTFCFKPVKIDTKP